MKTDKIPRGEAWVRLLEALRPIKEIRGEQFPKALKDYPELIVSLSSNVGYLRFIIDRARRRIRAGWDSDLDDFPHGIPGVEELDDLICMAAPKEMCDFWKGDIQAGKAWLGRALAELDLADIQVMPLDTVNCDDLIAQYREAVACFENIPVNLPPGEYIAAVENCQVQLDEIRQQLVDEGCICDLLFEEYQAAVACFPNIPDGLSDAEHLAAVQRCLEQLEDVQSRMNAWGCEY